MQTPVLETVTRSADERGENNSISSSVRQPSLVTLVLQTPLIFAGFYFRWVLPLALCALTRNPVAGARRWARWQAWPARSAERDTVSKLDFWTLRLLLRGDPRRTLARLLLLPFTAPRLALMTVAARGPAVRAKHGHSLLRQAIEVWQLQLRFPPTFAAEPELYYLNEFYRAECRPDAAFLMSSVHQKMLMRAVNGPREQSVGKRLFAERCAAEGLPHVPTVAEIEPHGRIRWSEGISGLPAEDLFSKPARERNGTGGARWFWSGDGRYRSESGRWLDTEATLDALRAAARQGLLLVQRRIRNHPAVEELVGDTTATVRFASILTPDGTFEPQLAMHRSSPVDSPVDNSARGGVASAIDLATGTLGPVLSMGEDGVEFSEHHPRTGKRVAGVQLPFWSETLRLVERAHRAFPAYPSLGWDVAITRDGPMLIEVNVIWNSKSLQAANRMPLGRHRLARRILESLESGGHVGENRQAR